MTEFNGNRMKRTDGNPIGDVDVFALDSNTRTIFPIEAKAFTLAKTPSEIGERGIPTKGDSKRFKSKTHRISVRLVDTSTLTLVLDRSLWLKNPKLGFIAVTVITLTSDERKIGLRVICCSTVGKRNTVADIPSPPIASMSSKNLISQPQSQP